MASTALLPRHDDGLVGDAPPTTAEPPLLITIPETARLLSCSSGLVKSMIRRGQLQPVKLGRLTRIPRAQLHAKFLTGQGISPCNAPQELLQSCGSSPRLTVRRVGAMKRNRHG
jgi:excisionase family DNA binding protein